MKPQTLFSWALIAALLLSGCATSAAASPVEGPRDGFTISAETRQKVGNNTTFRGVVVCQSAKDAKQKIDGTLYIVISDNGYEVNMERSVYGFSNSQWNGPRQEWQWHMGILKGYEPFHAWAVETLEYAPDRCWTFGIPVGDSWKYATKYFYWFNYDDPDQLIETYPTTWQAARAIPAYKLGELFGGGDEYTIPGCIFFQLGHPAQGVNCKSLLPS